MRCLNCTTEFEAVRGTQKYCCPECRRRYQKRQWRRRNYERQKYAETGLQVGWKRCQKCLTAFQFDNPRKMYCSMECQDAND